ncbi:MAG: carboxypeptidase-like regulatory domain-containing protein [Acidobacteriia bacterium]|nr:carboxypeptidase-like regulatory domain-containing protein [Terriglobia bacterium]
MRNSTVTRWIAAALVVALQLALAPAFAGGAPATLAGTVVAAASRAPVAGARVHVGDKRTGRIVISEATGADGAFAVGGLAPAAYDLAVESAGGLYVVSSPLPLAPGERRSVQLAVSSPPAQGGEKSKPPQKRSLSKVWNNPLAATLIVVGAAVIIGVIVGNATSETPTSPSAP